MYWNERTLTLATGKEYVHSPVAGAPAAVNLLAMTSSDRLSCKSMLTLKCRSEKLDVSCLIFGNFYQILVEGVGKPGIEEILVGEVCKTLTIKGVLKMLKGESVIENSNIIIASTFTSERMRGGIACQQKDKRECLHSERL